MNGQCVLHGGEEAGSDSSGAAVAAVLCLRHWVLAAALVAELGHGHAVLVEGHGVETGAAANPADRLRAARLLLAHREGLPVGGGQWRTVWEGQRQQSRSM